MMSTAQAEPNVAITDPDPNVPWQPTGLVVQPPLKVVSGRPSRREYLQQLWQRRHFIWFQARTQSSHRHRGMLLGNMWLIIAPTFDGLIYFLIFGILFASNGRIPNYTGYLIVGIFMFAYTSRCVSGCISIVYSSRSIIQAFLFPRAALPISVVIREAFSTIPVAVALVLLVYLLPPRETFSFWIFLVFPVFLLQTGFVLGVGLFAARIGAIIPDLRQLMPYLIRFWMYGSAVMFTLDRFENFPHLETLVQQNPMYIYLTTYREALLFGQPPSSVQLIELILWAVLPLVLGLEFFWRKEEEYGRIK